jgi:hypothetical protein
MHSAGTAAVPIVAVITSAGIVIIGRMGGKLSGRTLDGSQVTGSAGARPGGDWSEYSDGGYGSGEFSDWPPPLIGSGVSGRERSSVITGGRR